MDGPEKFEDEFGKEWREAFDDYSQAPPKSVWENIDKELTYQKMVYYKRSARVFQYLSAAVLLLAGFLGVYIFVFSLNTQFDGNPISAENNHPKPMNDLRIAIENFRLNGLTKSGGSLNTISSNTQNGLTETIGVNKDENHEDKDILVNAKSLAISDEGQSISELVDFEALEKLSPILPNYGMTIVANLDDHEVWRVADYSYLSKKSKKEGGFGKKKLWAGIDVGSSSFDPNYQSSSVTTINNSISPSSLQFSGARSDAIENRSPQIEESMSAGNTVSLGLNFGLNLSEKWSLSSGLLYNLSEATNNTNVVVKSSRVQEAIPASQEFKNISQVNSAVSANAVVEYDFQDVELSNEFQFATLPVKAGYMLVDNKLSVEINAGVAANFYLGNKLSDSSKEFADVSIGPGEQSAYREISFSGLAGVQLGYVFLNNFQVIVQPNYQQSINSLTKESTEFVASPSGFGVTTGLRYRFN